jgi:tetraacyldisaccharide 4'-kinase
LISALASAIARRRRAAFTGHPERRRRLARPVVSVGNIAVGGTGKTPLVAHVARILLAAGHRPAILSRGYARPRVLDGAVVVSNGQTVEASYETAGDEPMMLARQLPGCAVVVASDRYLAGALAERRLNCTAHILDDGFQHLQLARAIDIVVVTRCDLDDRVMPSGRLREPLDSLRAADAVVVHAGDGSEGRLRAIGAPRVFTMARRVGAPQDGRAFAFAGIGRPDAFFDALQDAGWDLCGRVSFRDHHRYSAADLDRLARDATRAGARLLVTTEKDAVRLELIAAPPMSVVFVPLGVTVEPAAEFERMVRQACEVAK